MEFIETKQTVKNTKYYCDKCDVYCRDKYTFNRHSFTSKHKNRGKPESCIVLSSLKQTSSNNFVTISDNSECDSDTDNSTENKYSYLEQDDIDKDNLTHICNICKKNYMSRNGLWRHKKKCCNMMSNSHNFVHFEQIQDGHGNNGYNSNNCTNDNDSEKLENLTSMIVEVVKQNQGFQKLIMEQNKQIIELSKNNLTTNNSNSVNNNTFNNTINNNINNKFNLQVFLNETCKDAINIKDFVDSLQVTLNDIEKVGELGFVEGISRIFINGLKKLDVNKRPIHCSDLKRETMYLKEEDTWKKDTENKDKLKRIIRLIADKNQMKIFDWKAAHPDYKDSESKTNDQYLQIVIASSGGKTDADDDRLYEKVLKNVAKQVTINKNLL